MYHLLPFTNKPGRGRSAETTGLPEECIVLWITFPYFLFKNTILESK